MPHTSAPDTSSKETPHAESPHDSHEEQDYLKALGLDPTNSFDFFNHELEPGEKAGNAIDFGDLDDEDLATDEEDERVSPSSDRLIDRVDTSPRGLEKAAHDNEYQDIIKGKEPAADVTDPLSYLFDGIVSPSSSAGRENGTKELQPSITAIETDNGATEPKRDGHIQYDERSTLAKPDIGVRRLTELPSQSKGRHGTLEQLQQKLFDGSEYPKNQEELEKSLWPNFRRGTIPKFMELLPPTKISYIGAKPHKRPKPVRPTKLNLEVAADQIWCFRRPSINNPRIQEKITRKGVIVIANTTSSNAIIAEDTDEESDFEVAPLGGVSWQDIQLSCADWDTYSEARSSTPERMKSDKDDLYSLYDPTAKTRNVGDFPTDILRAPQFKLPIFSDPERTTSKIAEGVVLDLNNDSRLLIGSIAPEPDPTRFFFRGHAVESDHLGTFSPSYTRRYNVSNDDAYDRLKVNQHEKIRINLGEMAVEHSMPAIRLQYPYYKTRLEVPEARAFHRPRMEFKPGKQVTFTTSRILKKHRRGKSPKSIFESTKHLSLGDNSTALLLEYSEEYPTMLSNFGMGSRLINYYRRENAEDTSHPEFDIGETAILLPQDKGPFYVFGDVDPGQAMSTLCNSMYRAPVFRHDADSTEFLVIRNTTEEKGSTWYIRNIENLLIVGQEFPTHEVPRPKSHVAHNAVKNRLKMITYRQIRRNKGASQAEIMKHFPGMDLMNGRQKLRDFLRYSNERKRWEMPHSEPVPDEETLWSLIKPEEVCVLESMQAGHQHLQDIGLGNEDDNSEDDGGQVGETVEQQLAPWKTSRAFIAAAQGRAMVQLHGEGDPSGRGEAFSFIKTTMRECFKAFGESVEDNLNARKTKVPGGHGHIIAKQEQAYKESIRRIWEAQKRSLSSKEMQSDTEMADAETINVDVDEMTPCPEPPSSTPTRRIDDDYSSISKFTMGKRTEKVLKITRHVRNEFGNIERMEELVTHPRVIRKYLKRQFAKEAKETDIMDVKPTGDKALDRYNIRRLEKELARLERNKAHRHEREKRKEKQKELQTRNLARDRTISFSPFTPGTSISGACDYPFGFDSGPTTPPTPESTSRRCTRCGQSIHNKGNKRLCPVHIKTEGISGPPPH